MVKAVKMRALGMLKASRGRNQNISIYFILSDWNEYFLFIIIVESIK